MKPSSAMALTSAMPGAGTPAAAAAPVATSFFAACVMASSFLPQAPSRTANATVSTRSDGWRLLIESPLTWWLRGLGVRAAADRGHPRQAMLSGASSADHIASADRKAAAAIQRADDDVGRTLIAAGDADRVLGPLGTVEADSLDRRLHHLLRDHRTGGCGTVHFELATVDGGLDRLRLDLLHVLGGGSAAGECRGGGQQDQAQGLREVHLRSPFVSWKVIYVLLLQPDLPRVS